MKASKAQPAPAVKKSGFNAKNYEKPGLTEDEIVEIKDTDGGGSIDPKCTSSFI
jgi:hypothetical protein